MKVRAIHVASSYRMGLTNQETLLAIAHKQNDLVDWIVVTGENEQCHGGFSSLAAHRIEFRVIVGFDEHHEIGRLVRQFSEIADDFRPGIVTVNTNWQLLIARLARLRVKQKYKLVYTINGFRHNSRGKALVARYLIGILLWLFADAIHAPSSYVARKFSLLKRKIVQIPLGEDDELFKKSAPPDFSAPLRLCFAGEFRHGKNQELIIAAFSDFLCASKDLASSLILPGDGPLRARAMRLAERLGISKRVEFPGHLTRSQMIDVYLKCQVAVIASNDETFGHCIAEPLVMQRLVISRRVGLAPDYIVSGKSGLFFEGKSELVKLLLQIRSMEDIDRAQICEEARAVGESFRWSNISRRYYDGIFVRLCPVEEAESICPAKLAVRRSGLGPH